MRCEVVVFIARKIDPALATRTRGFGSDRRLVVEVAASKQATPSGAMR
jgi:hypothetical protein